MTVLLYTYFYNVSLNVRRPTFFNIYNLPFLPLHQQIKAFNIFFTTRSQPRDKQNRARDFLLFKYFLINLFLTVSMENTQSNLSNY